MEGFTAFIMHAFLVPSHCDTGSAKSSTDMCLGDAEFDKALFQQDLLLGQKPGTVLLSCMDPELCSHQLAIKKPAVLSWVLCEKSQDNRYGIF